MGKLGESLSPFWSNIQGSLFPWLEEELDPPDRKATAIGYRGICKTRGLVVFWLLFSVEIVSHLR